MAGKKKSRRIVRQFNEYFGAGTLEDWQRLCQDVGLDGDYRSITQCRKALQTVHVNIHDLIDAVEQGTTPQHFANRRQLADYTRRTKRIYPKEEAKEMGPVRALLRLITY